jgi:hypothetical protein
VRLQLQVLVMKVAMSITIEAEDDLEFNAKTEIGFVLEELQETLENFVAEMDTDYPGVAVQVRSLDE